MANEITRRNFVKQTVVGSAVLGGTSAGLEALQSAAASTDPKKQLIAALGSIFIPSRPGDPGYQDLEAHGITDFVLEELKVDDAAVAAFNAGAKPFFGGKAFVDLDAKQREEYLSLVIDGSKISDAGQRKTLQGFYQTARRRILTSYYSNYPEHKVKRDAQGLPILKPGDTHQQTNPNTTRIVTGWDIAGYKGPMTWEEEEERRAIAKKTLPRWFEGDRKSTRLNSSHVSESRMPSSA